ncbi:hypothetical protein CBD41_00445 [bacterium TMED181]|nr:hypothetical protein [Planctomycetota bacterium]OUW47696.1 MAG: hypothetical protein CBD41_00445 [bacterium TMED181]
MHRRDFLLRGAAAGAGFLTSTGLQGANADTSKSPGEVVIISTWPFGKAANQAALESLQSGGSTLDAVEKGVMTAEADPAIQSVGYGGLPNRAGVVELDAAIQDGRTFESGAICALQGYRHPIRVARAVLDHSPHLVIVGDGAREFATDQGFPVEETLSEKARKAYQDWRKKHPDGKGPSEGHDTLGLVLLNSDGHLCVACTTSGLAWKHPGRVGDSPLLGHGLYADDEAGGCVATGDGEEITRVCGSFLVVEWMRKGATPDEAIAETLDRIARRSPKGRDVYASFVAIRADGVTGAGSMRGGFHQALTRNGKTEVIPVPAFNDRNTDDERR